MSVIVPTLSVCSGKGCMISGQVNGVSANILVDTGAATTVLSKDMWDRSREQGAKLILLDLILPRCWNRLPCSIRLLSRADLDFLWRGGQPSYFKSWGSSLSA